MNSIDELIDRYCTGRGISRQQFDAEGTLTQDQIDALWELAHTDDADPVIPAGLPGAGKRESALTDAEREYLSACQMEFEELMAGTFLPVQADDELSVRH